MNLTNLSQFIAFSKMFACGLAIGFVYDICMTFFRGQRMGKNLSDIIFWAAVASLVISSLYAASQFEIRLYLIGGLLLGWAFYALLLSRLMGYFLAPIKILCDTISNFFGIGAKKAKKQIVRVAELQKKNVEHYNKYAKYIFRKKSHAKDQENSADQ